MKDKTVYSDLKQRCQKFLLEKIQMKRTGTLFLLSGLCNQVLIHLALYASNKHSQTSN